MASEDIATVSTREEIAHCLLREIEERAAADRAAEVCARDAHIMLAKRFAERARMLAEQCRDDAAARPALRALSPILPK